MISRMYVLQAAGVEPGLCAATSLFSWGVAWHSEVLEP